MSSSSTIRQELPTTLSGYPEISFKQRKAELLAKDRIAVFVAENETKLVGYCVASTNGSQGEVDSLFVEPDSRKSITGESLMGAGMDWLRSHEPESIKVLVGQGNEEVVSFYETLGFRKRATVMALFASS